MNPNFHHRDSYEDPDTGENVVEFEDAETGDILEFRNATRDHRTNRQESSTTAPRTAGSNRTRAVLTRTHRGGVPSKSRYTNPRQPQPSGTVNTSGEYLAIKKDVIGDLLPMAGKIWAALLGQPGRPEYTGDPRSDFTNAALHREALAQHEQSQLRIMTVSDVAGRVLKLLMS